MAIFKSRMICYRLFLTEYGGMAMFAVWVLMIYFTFPGTYSTQPAVTTQTFGHKHGGTIYGFLFSSDIVNNLLLAVASEPILSRFGYLGLFLTVACFPILALGLTCLFPKQPSPQMLLARFNAQKEQKYEVTNMQEKPSTESA